MRTLRYNVHNLYPSAQVLFRAYATLSFGCVQVEARFIYTFEALGVTFGFYGSDL